MGSRVVSLRKLLPSRELKGERRLLKSRRKSEQNSNVRFDVSNVRQEDIFLRFNDYVINILLSLEEDYRCDK